ncbi:MAG TPA: hypothetical protein VJV79_05450 [Polyangiaceae bacterium]|nr:hypothetical protein [Polyangiaceae bacterium]
MDSVSTSGLFEANKDSVADFVLAGGEAIEPQPYRVLVVPGTPARVIVTDTLVFYDSMLPPYLVQRLRVGCAALGS